MGSEFGTYGIEMVILSPDTVAEARRMKRTVGLDMTVLSDADLRVIDLYGVRHEGAMGAPRDGSLIRPLAIPTTLLIDGDGIVRWIDQAEDYRMRSNPERILQALADTFSDPSAAPA
jgi:peroxiredoxin